MRGAQGYKFSVRKGMWIIPADAGSTPHHDRSGPMARDHPRGCGEHRPLYWRKTSERGSSPRMRGAPLPLGVICTLLRIIPADAGSTDKERIASDLLKDHPRGCGEHSCPLAPTLFRAGSSPRMRGALRLWWFVQPLVGIIPADAGSTCGHYMILGHSTGSSPRMRGAPSSSTSHLC